MNEQKLPHGIEWTRVWGRRGFTANPVKGCEHGCEWEMPDGQMAGCYAREIAENLAPRSYPGGFGVIRYDPTELSSIDRLKEPAGIFIDSMSDLFGRGVADMEIRKVLDCINRNPQHVFLSLTKNAPRLATFDLPKHQWVGVSAPPTVMFKHRLTLDQQDSYVRRALDVLHGISVAVRWMSVEPLSFNITDVFEAWETERCRKFPLDWMVIGAASRGKQLFQPNPVHVERLLAFADLRRIPVFFKGNLKWAPWRNAFPAPGAANAILKQEALL